MTSSTKERTNERTDKTRQDKKNNNYKLAEPKRRENKKYKTRQEYERKNKARQQDIPKERTMEIQTDRNK